MCAEHVCGIVKQESGSTPRRRVQKSTSAHRRATFCNRGVRVESAQEWVRMECQDQGWQDQG